MGPRLSLGPRLRPASAPATAPLAAAAAGDAPPGGGDATAPPPRAADGARLADAEEEASAEAGAEAGSSGGAAPVAGEGAQEDSGTAPADAAESAPPAAQAPADPPPQSPSATAAGDGTQAAAPAQAATGDDALSAAPAQARNTASADSGAGPGGLDALAARLAALEARAGGAPVLPSPASLPTRWPPWSGGSARSKTIPRATRSLARSANGPGSGPPWRPNSPRWARGSNASRRRRRSRPPPTGGWWRWCWRPAGSRPRSARRGPSRRRSTRCAGWPGPAATRRSRTPSRASRPSPPPAWRPSTGSGRAILRPPPPSSAPPLRATTPTGSTRP